MINGFNHKKAIQSLCFFAIKEKNNLNKMKAIKLIWLSDRLHLRKYGRTITGDMYFALKFGPVASNTRDILEESSFLSDEEKIYSIEFINILDKYTFSHKSFNENVFSKTDLDTLSEVYAAYGELDQFQLSEISHQFPEWKKFESSLNRNKSSRYLMNFEDFFKNADNVNSVFNENVEDLELSKALYFRLEPIEEI